MYYNNSRESNDLQGYIQDITFPEYQFYIKRKTNLQEYIAHNNNYYIIEPGYYYTVTPGVEVNVKGPVYFPANKIKCDSIKCLIKK